MQAAKVRLSSSHMTRRARTATDATARDGRRALLSRYTRAGRCPDPCGRLETEARDSQSAGLSETQALGMSLGSSQVCQQQHSARGFSGWARPRRGHIGCGCPP
jgi:hypothetical protein